ncbi:MAG: DEAD/DEAH box helicase [Bacteroidales bacterium]|nr:DEAD/DEAH box helicase [Bacteroidales bacterium]
MSQFEQLLSKDPIGAFEKIKEDYLRYFKTTFRFAGEIDNNTEREKYKDLDDRKNDELEKNENLSKELYCELLPKYESSGQNIDAVCKNWNCPKPLPNRFAEFVRSGLMDYPLYRHQKEMLEKGFGNDQNVLITSGTGSGKTESFMLPLLASLLNEAQKWPQQSYNPIWWQERKTIKEKKKEKEIILYDPNQRKNESRPSAIRSLLLYPMNALVADQVGRLRKALDSDDVRNFLDNECNGNRIFFGSYNGNTPKASKEETAELLDKMKKQAEGLQRAKNIGQCEPDDIYVAPRLSANSFTSEMLVREDMQQHAPDILITNVSMLSIMLMRSEEQGMLDQTKEYYEKNKDAVFHLVVDELHLHRGTAGAEVAYLLRMFLHRIGVPPMVNGQRNSQLRIYASSASIGGNPQQYLEDFFGVYDQANHTPQFIIQNGYDVPLTINNSLPALNYQHFDVFSRRNASRELYYEMKNIADKQQIESEFLQSINYNGSFDDFINDYAPTIYQDLLNLRKPSIASFALSELHDLPGNPDDAAIRGFFIFRGDDNVTNELLPNIRFHQFYKYIEGLWGELLPDSDPQGPIGELSFRPKEVSSNGAHKMLELLRCECCGELFIGGNRRTMDYGVGISLNDPNIDKIPNMQATPMVQRKNIEEYVVFWPKRRNEGTQDTINGFYRKDNADNHERFGLVNANDRHSSDEGNQNEHGAWREGFLNPYDSSIVWSLSPSQNQKKAEYIRGFVYYPTNNDGTNEVTTYGRITLKALPCKCPACEKDYLYRKYTQSPIRSFRTGMGRNNQILTKELIRQLDPNGDHLPKLVSFSDSRQDAAELSKRVSREHYRDMLRLLFIQIIKNKINGNAGPSLNTLKQTITALLNANLPCQTIVATINYDPNVSTTEKNALIDIVNSNVTLTQKIANINTYSPILDVIDLNKMITSNNTEIDGDLVKALLGIGINPEGTDYAELYPLYNEYWDRAYDFNGMKLDTNKSRQSIKRNQTSKSFFDWIKDGMQSNIFANCFGQYMNVNTEAAGLGYVMPSDWSSNTTVADLGIKMQTYLTNNNLTIGDVLSAMVRVFGDHYRYDGDFEVKDWQNYSDWKQSISKLVIKLADLCGVPQNDRDIDEFGQSLNIALKEVALDLNGKLQLSKPLRFKLMHSGDNYYKCRKCGRVHLHRGFGFCTNTACMHYLPTQASGNVDDLWKDNYISFDVMKEPHSATRMHSEELTGQTDDQTDRLLKFKDIILDPQNNEPVANKIDLLSVTTTMEVGVDIGSLQAIYQGNMPPTRYNYQQRVGRAGRRNQAYSAALTFCRGRSHDTYFYEKATDEITGGKPADPTLSVNPIVGQDTNLVIVKRIILKHILMEISAKRPEWAIHSGTCGQLGGVGAIQGNWQNDVRPEIKNWITNNNQEITDIVRYCLSQYIPNNANAETDILNWIQKDVLNLMDDAISNSVQGDNAQAIAEAGLLPMYGMPTAVRNFYHSGSRTGIRNHIFKENYDGIIDRPIEQAITEFAPGSMKTKDNAEYTSAGLTVQLDHIPMKDNLNDLAIVKDALDPLQYSYNISFVGDIVDSIEKYDQNQIDNTSTFRLVIPKAFRTDSIMFNKGDSLQEDDSRSNYMPSLIWVDAKTSHSPGISHGAGKREAWNGDKQKGDVWYLNTNNGKCFEGQLAWKKLNDRSGQYTIEPHYFTPLINAQNENSLIQFAPNFMINPKDQNWVTDRNKQTIVLGAKKLTDIICLSLDINKIPTCLNLCANDRNRAAIIAAFYSAATLIQRTFADKHDIDPQEIEVSEVKIDPYTNLPSVYLNDKAANGAGFVSMLNNELEDLLKDIVSPRPTSRFIQSILSHKSDCATSCPRCLNTFYNRGLHHVLDWRLGMDVIKLMVDSNYQMGYDDLANTPYDDLADVFNKLGERVQRAHPAGNVVYTPNNGHDWRTGYFTNDGRNVEHLIHPLWNVEDQESQDGFDAQDMFRLQRNVKASPKTHQAVQASQQPVQNTDQPVQKTSNGNADLGELG